jgi:beta-xylosidase
MLFTNSTGSSKNYAKDPGVIKFKGKYFLYHSIAYKQTEFFSLRLSIAESTDLETWKVVGDIPLTQECEKKGTGAPAAIVLNGKAHLFYQTYGNWERDAICHATSDDGLHFTPDPGNPIFKPTDDWCKGRAIDADICVFDGKLFLYFATRDHEMRVQKLGVAYADINSNFSKGDFVQAVNQTVLYPEFKWEGECIEAPASIVRGGKVFLFYAGGYNCYPQQIGCAISDDGVFFKKLFAEPFLPCGKPGEWNSEESGHPYIFEDDDGRTYLFFQGSNSGGKEWYISKTEVFWDNKGLPYLKK